MTYEQALHELVDDLIGLLDAPPVPAVELPTVHLAHEQILASVASIYGDLAATRITTPNPSTFRLANHPVAALRELLTRPLPRFPDERPPPPTGDATRLWQHASGRAAIAQHLWAVADERSRPTGHERWSALADLAAVVQGLSVLAPDPLPALALAAREVRRLAHLGPLPEVQQLQGIPHKPIRVRHQHDLGPALQRLADLVARADYIDPRSIGRISQDVALICTALSRTLDRRTTDRPDGLSPALANRLAALERAVRPPVAFTRGVTAATTLTDLRPEAQAREAWRVLNEGPVGRRGLIPRADVASLTAAAHELPRVTRAVLTSATRQVNNGHWLVPGPGITLQWVSAATADQSPSALDHLRRAATEAGRLIPPRAHPRSGTTAKWRVSERLALVLDGSGGRPSQPFYHPLFR